MHLLKAGTISGSGGGAGTGVHTYSVRGGPAFWCWISPQQWGEVGVVFLHVRMAQGKMAQKFSHLPREVAGLGFLSKSGGNGVQ